MLFLLSFIVKKNYHSFHDSYDKTVIIFCIHLLFILHNFIKERVHLTLILTLTFLRFRADASL